MATKGQEVAQDNIGKRSHQCNNCLKEETLDYQFQRCSVCTLARYCSKQRNIVEHIKNLPKNDHFGMCNSSDKHMFASHLAPNQMSQLAKLVGDKCFVSCELDGVQTNVLWNTVVQVSIMPAGFSHKNFLNSHVKDIQ